MNFFSLWFKKFKQFLKDRNILIIILISLGLLILIWVLWLVKIKNLGPLFTPLTWAPASISDFIIPIISTFIFILNLLLALKAYFKEILAAYFLLLSSLFVQILVLILIHFYWTTG